MKIEFFLYDMMRQTGRGKCIAVQECTFKNSEGRARGHYTGCSRHDRLFYWRCRSLFHRIEPTTFDLSDPGWSSSGSAGELINQGGSWCYLADISYSLAGVLAGVIPLALLFGPIGALNRYLRLR